MFSSKGLNCALEKSKTLNHEIYHCLHLCSNVILLANAFLTSINSNPALNSCFLSFIYFFCIAVTTIWYTMYSLLCFCLSPSHWGVSSIREYLFSHCAIPNKVAGTNVLNNDLLNEYTNDCGNPNQSTH